MSQNLPERSLRDFLSLRHPNHFVLAGANNRNVIITYRFLGAPVQANGDPPKAREKRPGDEVGELLECLLGISPFGGNPCGGNNPNHVFFLFFPRFLKLCFHTILNKSKNIVFHVNFPPLPCMCL